MIRFLTAGESHGYSLNMVIDGMPAGIELNETELNEDLKRRQCGYGRGGRMKIETDKMIIKSGVRFGITTGSPIAIEIMNKDFENWKVPMSVMPVSSTEENVLKIKEKEISRVRPGHADFAGSVKYGFDDVRNVLERSSARETASRVAVGAIAKSFLKSFGITVQSYVSQIGEVKISENCPIDFDVVKNSELFCPDKSAEEKMKGLIDKAKAEGDTLGGRFTVIIKNAPVGLGSYTQWDRKLDAQFAGALMSIQAIKAVEVGLGVISAETCGSKMHDEIFYDGEKIYRKTNNAGGIEGGMTNGEDIILTCTMKPIPTMKKSLQTINIKNYEKESAHFERSDTCAVPACSVVAEAMSAVVLANAFIEKFGCDNYKEILANYNNYKKNHKGL